MDAERRLLCLECTKLLQRRASPLEKQVLTLYLRDWNQTESAALLGISQQRISQAFWRLIHKVRPLLTSKPREPRRESRRAAE